LYQGISEEALRQGQYVQCELEDLMELHCSIWQPLSRAQGRDNAKSPNLSNALLENWHLQQLAEEFVEHVNQVST
jgi:hypothetical protein